MISNYFKIIFRLLLRQKTFAFINIFGLTIGLAGFIMIFLYVRYELNYDKHNEKIDRLFMVFRDVHLDNNVYNFTPVPYPFKDAVTAEFPEIEKAVRIDTWGSTLFSFGEKTFEEPVAVADREIFDAFTFSLIAGNRDNPLPNESSVAISRRIAGKYFGNEEAIGKVFQVNGKFDFTVTAVYENLPPNSSLRADVILPFEYYKTLQYDMMNWQSNSVNVYLLLHPGTDVQAFGKKLEPRLAKNQPSDTPDKLFLHPYKDLHLHNFHYNGGAIQFVYLFSVIGVIILGLAAINYVNLVTARSIRRAKEIGIRKTVGAEKSQVIFQFLGESVLLALIALNFAVLLVELLLPVVNPVIGKTLVIEYTNPAQILSMAGIALGTGLLAGLYPAFYLSKFNPSAVLKSSAAAKGGTFKSALVVIQFAVSIALIITSIILYRQLDHLQNLPPGFSKENVFYFKIEDTAKKDIGLLKKDLQQLQFVESVSMGSHLPSSIFSNGGGFSWEGKDPAQDVLISFTRTDHDFARTFGMKLVQGRYFQENEVVTDTINKIEKVVINQRMAQIMNVTDAVGKSLQTGEWRLEIIGVVADFNFTQMRSTQGPLLMSYAPDNTSYGFVRVNGDLLKAREVLTEKYKTVFPQLPPDFRLYDDQYQMYFGREAQNAQIFGYFTVLAVIISCLGLYGLASFIAEQRRKEMGIRKALGANTTGLSFLMMKDFAIWILISNAVAIPVAWYYSNDLLSKYVFRAEITFWVFFGAALLSVIIAAITVVFQVARTAGENPANVLKYE